MGKALDMHPTAILSGLLLLVSYCSSDCIVEIPDTEWIEPVLVWITISMPSGSGKTPLFTFLVNLLEKVKDKFDEPQQFESPDWVLDDASFEKMGAMMASNNNKLLGIYDELGTFLSQINACRGKNLSESHELATFLSLYNAKSWKRSTGMLHNKFSVCMYISIIFCHVMITKQ